MPADWRDWRCPRLPVHALKKGHDAIPEPSWVEWVLGPVPGGRETHSEGGEGRARECGDTRHSIHVDTCE